MKTTGFTLLILILLLASFPLSAQIVSKVDDYKGSFKSISHDRLLSYDKRANLFYLSGISHVEDYASGRDRALYPKMDEPRKLALPERPADGFSATLSYDGKVVAYRLGEEVVVVTFESGEEKGRYPLAAEQPFALTADGSGLLVTTELGVSVIDPANGESKRAFTGPPGQGTFKQVQLSPNGSYLAAMTEKAVYAWEWASGAMVLFHAMENRETLGFDFDYFKNYLAMGYRKGEKGIYNVGVKVFKLESGEIEHQNWKVFLDVNERFFKDYNLITFNPLGRFIIFQIGGKRSKVYDIKKDEFVSNSLGLSNMAFTGQAMFHPHNPYFMYTKEIVNAIQLNRMMYLRYTTITKSPFQGFRPGQ